MTLVTRYAPSTSYQRKRLNNPSLPQVSRVLTITNVFIQRLCADRRRVSRNRRPNNITIPNWTVPLFSHFSSRRGSRIEFFNKARREMGRDRCWVDLSIASESNGSD